MATAEKSNCGVGHREGKMEKRKKQLKRSRTVLLMYSLVFLCTVLTVSSIAYVYKTAANMVAVHAPLVDAAVEIKLEISQAHLWFEELVTGDKTVTIDEVYKLQDGAFWYANAMLVGGTNSKGTFIPLEDEQLRQKIEIVIAKLKEFRARTEDRYAKSSESSIGSQIDQEYDRVFKEVIADADEVEARLQQTIKLQWRSFHAVQISLAILCVGFAVITAGFFHFFIRRSRRRQFRLATGNQQLKASEQQLAQQEKYYRTLLYSLHEDILVIGPDYRITDINNTALKTLGIKREDAIGRHCYEVSHGLDTPCHEHGEKCGLRTVFDTGKHCNLCHEHTRKNGEKVYVDLMMSPLKDEDGKVTHVVEAARDVSDLFYAQAELKAANQQLMASEEKYKGLFEFMSSGVAVYEAVDDGKDFIFMDFNQAGEKIEKLKRDKLIGKSLLEVFPGVKEFGLFEVIQRVWKTGKSEYHPITIYQDERISGWRENYVYKLPSGEVVAVYDDVTRRKKAEEELRATNQQLTASDQQLRASNQQLRASDKEREKFLKVLTTKNQELQSIVFIASHDLRSPLVNVKGFAGELEKSCDKLAKVLDHKAITKPLRGEIEPLLREDIPESLHFIKAGADKMDSLISGLLRLSRIGTAELDIDRLDMSEMVKSILKTVRFNIQQRDAKIDIGDMPSCLGDSSLVNQVFSNLIDNALKYVDPKRGAQIQISGKSEDGNVIYCVQDNGIGISDEHREKIFEIFHRLHPKETDGEGLGLTIIRRILDRQDGRIWVESEHGKGSKFYVSLPTD